MNQSRSYRTDRFQKYFCFVNDHQVEQQNVLNGCSRYVIILKLSSESRRFKIKNSNRNFFYRTIVVYLIKIHWRVPLYYSDTTRPVQQLNVLAGKRFRILHANGARIVAVGIVLNYSLPFHQVFSPFCVIYYTQLFYVSSPSINLGVH